MKKYALALFAAAALVLAMGNTSAFAVEKNTSLNGGLPPLPAARGEAYGGAIPLPSPTPPAGMTVEECRKKANGALYSWNGTTGGCDISATASPKEK